MSEAVEFEVQDTGAPNLEGDGQVAEGPDQPAAAATALMPVPGWTPAEATLVVGGLVANVVLAMYLIRWSQPPAAELWPAIAGDPEREFPLLGAGLAPVLDFIAPKGSPQAVGVSLTAGLGEIVGALARRAQVVNTPPTPSSGARDAGRPAAAAPAPGQPPPAPAAANGDGRFRYSAAELRVLGQPDSPLAGLGLA